MLQKQKAHIPEGMGLVETSMISLAPGD